MIDKKRHPSQLRYDLVSKDWVVIATGRARRPETFSSNGRGAGEQSRASCPFESLDDQEHPVSIMRGGAKVPYRDGEEIPEWTTISLPNKYPAFAPSDDLGRKQIGPYSLMEGVGHHEVIVTTDHARDIPQFSTQEIEELVAMYQDRYLDLKDRDFVAYVSVFKNKGPAAGATVAHPHSQVMALPITDPDLERSMRGSKEYMDEHGVCVHCAMLAWDEKEETRLVYANEGFLAICPFASRVAFEVRIYPRQHQPRFEAIDERERSLFADALGAVMRKLSAGLGDPDYNYFIHTSPAREGLYEHYHWHLEILPKTSTWAGFELGTGIEISTIDPESAAIFLRQQ